MEIPPLHSSAHLARLTADQSLGVNPTPLHPQSKIDTTDLPFEILASNPHVSEETKIAAATQQFEAILLRQILSDTHKNLFNTGLGSADASSSIYLDMITAQLAETISKSGGFGLAESLRAQLSHTTQTPPNTHAVSKPNIPTQHHD